MEEESLIIKSLNKKENIQDKKSMGKSNNKKDLGKKPCKEKDLGKKLLCDDDIEFCLKNERKELVNRFCKYMDDLLQITKVNDFHSSIEKLRQKSNELKKEEIKKSNSQDNKNDGKKPGKEKDLGKKADKGKSKIKVCGQQLNYGNASTNNTTLHKDIEEKQIQEMNKICIKKDSEKTDEIFTI